MNIGLVQGLIIAGTVQGFIFAANVLITRKRRDRSLFYLAILVASFSYSNFQYMLPQLGVVSLDHMYAYIFLPIAPLMPALIYGFVLTFLQPEQRLNTLGKTLFFPFLFFLFFTFVYRIARITDYQNATLQVFLDWLQDLQELTAIALMFLVLLRSLWNTRVVFRKNGFRERRERQPLLWLQITLVLFLLTSVLWTYTVVKNIFYQYFDMVLFYILWIVMSFLIYWLGYMGLYRYELWKEREKVRKLPRSKNGTNQKSADQNPKLEELQALMTNEKIYLDPQLSLETVASKLGLSSGHLSRLLNKERNTSFTDYLNEYRVGEAMQLLQNTSFNKYTMTAIGLESGFNSKSTFFKIFKEKTGSTPSAYKNANVINQS